MPSASPPAAASHAPPGRSSGPPRLWRWSTILAAVLIAHAVIGVWLARNRQLFAPPAAKPPVEVVLLQPARIANTPSSRRTAGAQPAQAQTPHQEDHKETQREPQRETQRQGEGERQIETARRKAAPDGALQAPTPAAPAPTQPAPGQGASSAEAGAGSDARTGAGRAPGGTSTASGNAGEPGQGLKFSAPPSGELRYETFFNGMRNAPGTIRWHSDGNGYAMVVSVPLPFVGTFTYESEGRIDGFGLAPQRYIEARGRRGANVTTFDRSARRIGFTRTPATLELPDGAQDRFSVIMQLASLVRGDPDAYKPGVTRNFYVADNDSGETWPIETVGDETVRTPAGFVAARHFMRLPRHAGDTRRIDVWLAPSLGWLPARIVQTEPNGSQIELVWAGALAPPGPENAPSSASSEHSSDSAQTTEPTRVQP